MNGATLFMFPGILIDLWLLISYIFNKYDLVDLQQTDPTAVFPVPVQIVATKTYYPNQ